MPVVSQTAPTSVIPGVYAQIIAAPKSIGSIPSDVVAIVGEFSRGPLDTPLYCETIGDIKGSFAGATLNTAVPNTLLSGYPAALLVSGQGVQRKILVRVAAATAATGYITLSNATGPMLTLHAASPGTWANGNIVATVSAGSTVSLWNLLIQNSATGETDNIVGLPWNDMNAAMRQINATSLLCTAALPVINAPAAAPTLTASTGSGTLPAGTYYFIATYTNASGETIGSPESVATVLSAPGNIIVTLPSVTGAVGIKVYATTGAAGSEVFYAQNASGLTTTLSTVITPGTATPPVVNAATSIVAPNVSAMPTVGATTFNTASQAAGSGAAPGNDGVGASSARHLGVSGSPSTGIYALAGLQPHPTVVFCAGAAGTDQTTWAAQAQAGMDNDWLAVVSLPKGTTYASAQTLMANATVTGIANTMQGDFIKVGYPGITFYESEVLQNAYTVEGTAHFAGVTAVQIANTSAANKPLYNIVTPEFTFSRTQVTALIGLNLNVVGQTLTRDVNGVPAWGMVTDTCLSGRKSFEVRMQSLVIEDFGSLGGYFVEVPNSPDLWATAQDVFLGRLDSYARQGLIPANPYNAASSTQAPQTTLPTSVKKLGIQTSTVPPVAATVVNYRVICDSSNNRIGGQITNNLYVDTEVTLFPNVDRLVFRTTIGANVQITLAASNKG